MEQIDVTKCIGCRKGINCFVEFDKEFYHLDMFATPEAGETFFCENSDEVAKHIIKHGNGAFILKDEYDVAFTKQSQWWDDMIYLANDIFHSPEAVSVFFNEGEIGNKVWNKPNIEIETILLELADKAGIDTSGEAYPNLIKNTKDNVDA